MLLEPVENIMTSSGVSSSLMSSSVVSSVALGVGPMAGVDAMKVSMAPCAAVSRGVLVWRMALVGHMQLVVPTTVSVGPIGPLAPDKSMLSTKVWAGLSVKVCGRDCPSKYVGALLVLGPARGDGGDGGEPVSLSLVFQVLVL